MFLRTLLVAVCLAAPAFAQSPGPQGAEGKTMREQEWRIPTASGSLLMETTVFRPAGEAKAPLVVINHGSPADGSERQTMTRPLYVALSSFFVAHGYVVVLPLRRGYGATGGGWAEDYGSCKSPNFTRAGLETASDIKAAIDSMRRQPFVLQDRTIVVGHSAGGWGTLALSSLDPPGVAGMIDFAGGRGGHQPGIGNCEPQAMVKSAAVYGRTARVPLLWINAQNDTFFEPRLVEKMVAAYNGAGGKAIHRAVGPFGNEGHNLASAQSGTLIWQPMVDDFLKTTK
jgi:pimeloyl-ACP methyl ester carboxylesterase